MTRWPPFCRKNFQMHFWLWKWLNFEYNFSEVCSQASNWQVSIGSGNGMVQNRWLTTYITWSALVQVMAWCRANESPLPTSLGHNELSFILFDPRTFPHRENWISLGSRKWLITCVMPNLYLNYIKQNRFMINSLVSSDTVWSLRSLSSLVQVMAYCLMASSHCLN